jgi:hypothetical protein
VRAWHGTEAHSLCTEWLTAAINAGAYGNKALASLNAGGKKKQKVLQDLQPVAFPGTKQGKFSGPGDEIKLPGELFRFGSKDGTPLSGAPLKPSTFPVTPVVPKRLVPGNAPFDFDPPQIPKSMVERPVMKKALPGGTAHKALDPASKQEAPPRLSPEDRVPLADRMTPALWEKMAQKHPGPAVLDESSRRFMMAKLPADVLLPEEIAKGAAANPGTPFGKTLARFTIAITNDMVRNEYLNHNRIHQWLEEDTKGVLSGNVEELNKKVYELLFLTPDYDAWLGLVPEDTYTALEKDGCACDKGAPPMHSPVSASR